MAKERIVLPKDLASWSKYDSRAIDMTRTIILHNIQRTRRQGDAELINKIKTKN